ncbi:hypothetical protein AAFF_G00082100 [Aldrovandia affinis]|uniref:Reverse transcriptase/retrotransposon-derived protein RNase H-like domain-containing protein n=1 Tax=Aldrovandia affinis TaxID=143900 RepID=A0AAD7T4C1_9TELE|nr:hypothetical protein AAFF_G00082100 [Aldrovandia affinis]
MAKDKDCTCTTVTQHHRLRSGIIQPSDSPWVSPAVLVQKKDGSLRFCIDYCCLNKENLRLNLVKCSLFCRQTSFLGHIVSEREVLTDLAKVEAAEKCLSPMSTSEVCSFLGLASYYRRFIAGFANITRRLHQLTEKGQRFTWSPASQDAFDHLRKALITAPILAIPDLMKTLYSGH